MQKYDSLNGTPLDTIGTWAPVFATAGKPINGNLKKYDTLQILIHLIKPPKMNVSAILKMGFKNQEELIDINSNQRNPFEFNIPLRDTGEYFISIIGVETDSVASVKKYVSRYPVNHLKFIVK